MKRMVKCSDMSSEARNWITSEEVDELLKGCTSREKRLVARLSQSTSPVEYLYGLLDTVVFLDPEISESFDTFLKEAAERIR